MKIKKFTKPREFYLSYSMIDTLNRYIWDLEFERECFIKHQNFSEAECREKLIEHFKQSLKEFENQGYIIT
ncbi:MAG: hypothetical protein LBE36_06460 [Flavobacteriaceae bacterium]|nr:hypothetical protein [Flavobacteriaceae bacterium]